jgi:hypothetical protein
VARVDRRENRRIPHDLHRPQHRQRGEPKDHHRTEPGSHPLGAAALEGEQPDQHRHRERHDVALERRGRDRQPLDGAEHGDRRCDHAVAEKQRGAEQPGREHEP